MLFRSEGAFGQVETEAFAIAKKLGLDRHWLNHLSQGFAYKLPEGWRERRRHLGDFSLLKVYYIDRLDFIVLKVLAARDKDIADLLRVGVTPQEAEFVRQHAQRLHAAGRIDIDALSETLMVLDALETRS